MVSIFLCSCVIVSYLFVPLTFAYRTQGFFQLGNILVSCVCSLVSDAQHSFNGSTIFFRQLETWLFLLLLCHFGPILFVLLVTVLCNLRGNFCVTYNISCNAESLILVTINNYFPHLDLLFLYVVQFCLRQSCSVLFVIGRSFDVRASFVFHVFLQYVHPFGSYCFVQLHNSSSFVISISGLIWPE